MGRHGHECWEVDALDPETLQALVRSAFEGVIDEASMQEVVLQEDEDKERLREALGDLYD